MSKVHDFVYDAIRNGALEAKVNPAIAERYAKLGLGRYRKSDMRGLKVGAFIKTQIDEAKKASKGVK